MAKQYGFYFDADRCVQCYTCQLACKSTHNTEPGINLRRVIDIWTGEFPDIIRSFFSLSCLHCGKPKCMEVCPTQAISKRTEDGIVVVDRNKCNGCKECLYSCPYDVPQFGDDGIMQKCDFCTETGQEPACALNCPVEALHYGTMEELSELAIKKGAKRLKGSTEPSIFILEKSGNNILNKLSSW